MGKEDGLQGVERIALDNVIGEIFGTRSSKGKEERWHRSSGYRVQAGVRVVRVWRGGKMVEDLIQMTRDLAKTTLISKYMYTYGLLFKCLIHHFNINSYD